MPSPWSGLSAGWTGALAALGATLLWSGNFVIARGVSDAIAPATLAFLRWSVACAALAPFAAKAVIRDRTIIRAHLGFLLLTALLGVTVFNTLVYMSGHYTTTLNMALISTFIPVFMLLLSRIFLGEVMTWTKIAGMGVAVTGVVILLTRGRPAVLLDLTLNRGDLIMLADALVFAAYSLLVRKKPAALGPATMLGASFGLGLVMLLPWTILEQAAQPGAQLTMQTMGAVLYIGLGASLAAFWLWNMALERIGPANAGFIYYCLPLFAGLEASLFLGEPITWVHALSGALIIGGIFLATRYGNRIKTK